MTLRESLDFSKSSLTGLAAQLKLAKVAIPEVDKQYNQAVAAVTRIETELVKAKVNLALPVPVSVNLPPRFSLARATQVRGTNWSCYEDGRPDILPTPGYLQRVQVVRLPLDWDYDLKAIHAFLDLADSVANCCVLLEAHSYGRVGNARDGGGVPTGRLATPQEIAAHNLKICRDFKQHPSAVFCTDNEPKQSAADWELATQLTVDAWRADGHKGVVGITSAGNSFGDWKHNSPWIKDSGEHFYCQSFYLDPPGSFNWSVDQFDSYARGRGFKDYSDFLRSWFYWGVLGKTNGWEKEVILANEVWFKNKVHFDVFNALADKEGLGYLLWADGNWNDNYEQRVTEAQLQWLDRARV